MSIKWKRPSGTILETNDRDVTIAYCEKLGFERMGKDGGEPKESTKVIEPVKPDSVTKKKAGRPKKVVAD
jgi:hypothetical protein